MLAVVRCLTGYKCFYKNYFMEPVNSLRSEQLKSFRQQSFPEICLQISSAKEDREKKTPTSPLIRIWQKYDYRKEENE